MVFASLEPARQQRGLAPAWVDSVFGHAFALLPDLALAALARAPLARKNAYLLAEH